MEFFDKIKKTVDKVLRSFGFVSNESNSTLDKNNDKLCNNEVVTGTEIDDNLNDNSESKTESDCKKISDEASCHCEDNEDEDA